MKRLEALRLELDSRRRTVTDLQGRCERVRANLGTTRARGEADMELTLRKMQHKEDKMQRTASQFQEMEQTVYNSLFTLIKDTCVLRDYAAAALLIINVRTKSPFRCVFCSQYCFQNNDTHCTLWHPFAYTPHTHATPLLG
jgi:hypothetical protein